MFLQAVLLLGIISSAGHRPSDGLLRSLTPPQEDLDEDAEDVVSEESQPRAEELGPNQRVITFQPGTLGLSLNARIGKILGVRRGGQAKAQRLQVGDYIVKVGSRKYSSAAYAKALQKSEEFHGTWQITVESHSPMMQKIRAALGVLSVLAGIVGFSILCSLPLIVYHGANGTVEVSKPVMFVILTAVLLQAFGHLGRVVLDWSHFGIGAKLLEIAFSAFVAGVVMGCVTCGVRSPLQTELREDMAVEIGRLRRVPLLFFVISVCSESLKALARHAPTSIAECDGTQLFDIMLKLVRESAWNPLYFALFLFSCSISQIVIAARQQMLEVTEAISPHKGQWAQNVHAPCAQLLRDVPPKLLAVGFPVILLAVGGVYPASCLYDVAMELMLVNVRSTLTRWAAATCCLIIEDVSQTAAMFWAVAIGPVQLSLSIRELKKQLAETRQRDNTMHLEVQAVEEMLRQARFK
eukprot:Skav222710  [mRNA]  locus=scaffold1661:166409:167806:- [translate_table: standard]